MAFVAPADEGRPNDLGHLQPVEVQNTIVTARQLTMQFGNQYAVQDVTFDVPAGTIFGFIGPSGSGKTTTIRLMTGVYKPTSGEVFIFGKKPAEFSQGIRAKIGYMPQLFVLYPNLTILENLNFTASLYGMSLRRKKRLLEVLDFVELTDDRNKLARSASGGMQRRLSLAATLLHRPELLFLDEPTAGVDPVLRRKFWDHFKSLQDAGRTIFLTTQYVNEAAYCDLVGVMAEGKLLLVDTPEGLRRRAFGGEVVNLRTAIPIGYQMVNEMQRLPYVRGEIVHIGPNQIHIVVDEASTAMVDLIEWTRRQGIDVEAIEEFLPPFDDVFVELVRGEQENG